MSVSGLNEERDREEEDVTRVGPSIAHPRFVRPFLFSVRLMPHLSRLLHTQIQYLVAVHMHRVIRRQYLVQGPRGLEQGSALEYMCGAVERTGYREVTGVVQ